MEVDATFKMGSKRLLIALLNAVKDFNKPNSLSLRFSRAPTAAQQQQQQQPGQPAANAVAVSARFACGPPSFPMRSLISFQLFAVPSEDSEGAEGADDNAAAGVGGNVTNAGTTFASLGCRSDTVITVHPRTLCHQLELVDDGDRITVRCEKTGEGDVPIYELYFESPDLGRKVLYEMDTVPRVEPIPPIANVQRYAFIVQIEAEEFRRTIAALHETSEKILITGSKNSITFCASGNIGTLQVGLVQKPSSSADRVPRFKVLSFVSAIRVTVDSRFLRGFTSATPLSTYVTLSFGPQPQTPLKLTYPIEADTLADGSIRLASLSGHSSPHHHMPTHSVNGSAAGTPAASGSATPAGAPGSPVRDGADDVGAAHSASAGSPVGSPVKREVGANVVGRKVMGRLDYYLLPERE